MSPAKPLFSLIATFAFSGSAIGADPEIIPLWPKGAPLAVGDTPADHPRLHLHKPAPDAKPSGGAVVVCPGGGYGTVVMSYEGHEVADWFAKRGFTAVVLQYRIAPRYKHPAMILDVQRAIRTLRSHADDWKIDPEKIGVIGFSAGGHLAASASTKFADEFAEPTDGIDRLSARPDFAILAYGVLTLTEPYTHAGTRKNLLGTDPDPELVRSMSPDKNVTAKTPPTFLFHTGQDKVVPSENATGYYAALRKAGVPAELHIVPEGPHGVGLARHPASASWPDLLESWLTRNKFR